MFGLCWSLLLCSTGGWQAICSYSVSLCNLLLYMASSRTDDGGNFFGNRSCAAWQENIHEAPISIRLLNLWFTTQAQVVAAVVFIGNRSPLLMPPWQTSGHFWPVWLSSRLFSGSFLCHELYSHGTSFTHLYFVFPSEEEPRKLTPSLYSSTCICL